MPEQTENIDALIARFLSGEASPEEAMELEDWKQIHPDNLHYYTSVAKLYAGSLHTVLLHEPDLKTGWQTLQDQLHPPAQIKPITQTGKTKHYLSIAASVSLFILLGFLALYIFRKKTDETLIYAAATTALPVTLNDGSHIIVSPNSEVRLDKAFKSGKRTIYLKGSASFSVVHDEHKPFIVDAGNLYIKDIGTRFTIRQSSDTDTVFIKVDEGIVLLFDSIGTELEIKATQSAVYVRSRKQIIIPEEQTLLPSAVSEMVFTNSKLGTVLAELNRRYKSAIGVQNEALNECTITTRFGQEDLETVLTVICETLGLTYEKNGKTYLIKGQACTP